MVLREIIKGNIIPVHVKGHQDRDNTDLSEMEHLNVQMDVLAKEILESAILSKEDTPDALPLTKAGIPQVDYQDIPISSSLASTL